MRYLLGVLKCVVATEANSKFLNTTRHHDYSELLTVLLRAVMEEMKSKEQTGCWLTGWASIARTFGAGWSVRII